MKMSRAPPRPLSLARSISRRQSLKRDVLKELKVEAPIEIKEITTSEQMLEALAQQLIALSKSAMSKPSLQRSQSVSYLEEKILPAVKAVHTRAYIERLATTCVSLQDKAEGTKAELDDDTVVSATSLSAALCAVLSCCYAVDACCDPNLPYRNAFAVIRPPGHHAGANGPTAGPEAFAAISTAAAENATPVAACGYMPPPSPLGAPPPAFAFAHNPVPCDGVDCSQGFCLLNNAAIAARHALVRARPAPAPRAPRAHPARTRCIRLRPA